MHLTRGSWLKELPSQDDGLSDGGTVNTVRANYAPYTGKLAERATEPGRRAVRWLNSEHSKEWIVLTVSSG
jgi:hypothetical protein